MAWVIGLVLCAITIAIHHEFMRVLGRAIRKSRKGSRLGLVAAVMVLVVAHVLEVYLFAGAFYLGENWIEIGSLQGEVSGDLNDYAYFSAVSYTSVGYGDVFATGYLRIIAGLEALIGLLMIAWSGAFTVYFMQHHWSDDVLTDV